MAQCYTIHDTMKLENKVGNIHGIIIMCKLESVACLIYHFLVQSCLRAPPVVVDKAKLAIVFAYFLVPACLRKPHVVADEAIVFTYFFLLFFPFFFFFSAFYFSPTSGNLPCVKICFPQYFGITRRYMQKKNFFLGNLYLFTNKS